jgi:hypothetical protein
VGRSRVTDDVAIHGALMGIDVEQVKRSDTTAGFVPIAQTVGGRAGQRHADAAPPTRARVRDPPANHTESLRAKLKRLAARSVLTEAEPGLFTLAQPATSMGRIAGGERVSSSRPSGATKTGARSRCR